MKKGVKIGLIIIAVILVIGGCSYAAANLAMDSMLNKMEHAEKIEMMMRKSHPRLVKL